MCDFNDHWVEMAMADDSLVANLLLSFNRPASRIFDVHWTVRHRRSPRNKLKSTARASPTTPLSWTAATSPSDAADASDDSTLPSKPPDGARSKTEDQSETATAKRPRKKRTLPELFEKEKLLLEERRDLKNQLASLHLTVEQHRARNQSLKRMKVDLVSRHSSNIAATSLVSEKVVLDLPQPVKAPQSELVLLQTVKDKALNDDESLVEAHPSELVSPQTEKDNDESPVCKRMKVDLVSRHCSEIAATSLVSEKAVLDPPHFAEAHQPELVSPQKCKDKIPNCESLVEAHQSEAVLPQTDKVKLPNDESLVCSANASSEQQERGNQEPFFLLPDLNEPLEEEDFDTNDVPKIS